MKEQTLFINALQNPKTQEIGFKTLIKEYQQPLYWHIRKIVLDHDWLTGKFRNWSCINCNAKHSEKTYEEADKNNRKWYHVGEYNDT